MKNLMYLLSVVLLIACSESELDDINETPPDLGQGGGTYSSDVILINDDLEGEKIIIAGNAVKQYIVSFYRTLDDKLLEFKSTEEALPIIMEDNEGNSWDIFGYAIRGPRKGQRLRATQSLMGYWFSFATFYPGLQIYPDAEKGVNDGEKITGTGNWLVPESEVRSGGVGRDGIPAVSTPKFDAAGQLEFLADDDLVVGFSYQETQMAYPHDVLDWHEIVNDVISDLDYAIIYCPLTGTATAWNRKINGTLTSFGVSGLLYNSNIVPYDRATGSNWSQLLNTAIWGEKKGKKPKNHMVLETTFSTWKELYPTSKVMNFSTGYNRNYGSYPYGDYKTSKQFIFPVKYEDRRLHEKERVHAVRVNGKVRVYRFLSFTGN